MNRSYFSWVIMNFVSERFGLLNFSLISLATTLSSELLGLMSGAKLSWMRAARMSLKCLVRSSWLNDLQESDNDRREVVTWTKRRYFWNLTKRGIIFRRRYNHTHQDKLVN